MKKVLKGVITLLITQTVRSYFGEDVYASTSSRATYIQTRLCMREEYNSDSRNTKPPFVVAMFGSEDENFNTHAPNHYLKIEEHGYDIYGTEATTLYDLTGFYS